jgi:hypothetical protein
MTGTKQKQKTPAQAQRGKLTAAIRTRGERPYNIWLIRPPFESRDLILNSDPQFEAFYVLEGESSFSDIRYLPQWYNSEDREQPSSGAREFARVTTTDKQELSIYLSFGREPRKGSTAEMAQIGGVINIDMLVLNHYIQRVENWRRVIPCIRRVRLHATSSIERQIAILLHGMGRTPLRNLAARFSNLDAALVYGAVAILLRRRELLSDLDTRVWSLDTLLWNAEP